MTADTFSNGLGFLIMGVGNDNNSWGTNANNSVFQIFEDSIAGQSTVSVTGGTLDLSGTPPPAAASQARYGIFYINGALTSNQTIIVPNLPKTWVVFNNTSGAFSLLWQVTGGTTKQVPQGTSRILWCDGSAVMHRMDIEEVGQFADFACPIVPNGYFERNGTALLRASYPDLFAAICISTTGNTTNTSPIVTNIPSTSGFAAGMPISGTGIPSSTTILSVDSSTQIHLSQNATSSNTGGAFVVAPWGVGDGSTTFNLPTSNDTGRFTRARTSSVAVGVKQSNIFASHNHTATPSLGIGGTTDVAGSHNHTGNTAIGQAALSFNNNFLVTSALPVNPIGAAQCPNFATVVFTGLVDTGHLHGISADGSHTHTLSSVTVTGSVTIGSTGGAETRPESAVALGCIRY